MINRATVNPDSARMPTPAIPSHVRPSAFQQFSKCLPPTICPSSKFDSGNRSVAFKRGKNQKTHPSVNADFFSAHKSFTPLAFATGTAVIAADASVQIRATTSMGWSFIARARFRFKSPAVSNLRRRATKRNHEPDTVGNCFGPYPRLFGLRTEQNRIVSKIRVGVE